MREGGSPLEVGSNYSEDCSFSQATVANYSSVTGDSNPIHLSIEAAKAAGFEGTIVHGMLAASRFSNILGTKFPGSGTIYLGQSLTFKAPILVDESLICTLTVTAVRPDKPIAFISTELTSRKTGEVKVTGEAVVKHMMPGIPTL